MVIMNKKLKDYIVNFFNGFAMALADSVPGVSGGTIAFLLGFYDQFINSLNYLLTKNINHRKSGIRFLGKIGIGWIVGMISSILILTSVFESHIYKVSSLFMGFIILSIPIIISEEKEVLKKSNKKQMIFFRIFNKITYNLLIKIVYPFSFNELIANINRLKSEGKVCTFTACTENTKEDKSDTFPDPLYGNTFFSKSHNYDNK